ncbi:uncharacterized protein zgc:112970 [Sardina pilchardus]|uniref:uncharacterized protein zgc:112970 n=1 Tax=Sardina pilchardus TaxID=27697 RepID=UPI002E12BB4D
MLATPKRGEICRLATHLSNQSFPGFFKLGGKRGKKRFFAASTQKSKTVALNFYLLPKNTTLTPLPAEELELLQAGMGRKSVSMPETGDHSEITQVLTDTFPKMENLAGGWLLHKASGGSGRRKLTVIPPEAEGYSVKALRAVSTGGKAILFIVPLQERLDTSPLPLDSEQFSKMPKKTCYQCSEVMPLQMLAVHIQTCTGQSTNDTDVQSSDESSDEVCFIEKKEVACPICNQQFPDDEIAIHAGLCGESDFGCSVPSEKDDYVGSGAAEISLCEPKSTEDILQFLEQQVDTTTQFKLCVDRAELLDRAILQWRRKKMASPASALKVVYLGEAGIDTGALRKEFLTDMIVAIESRFFEGSGSQGKNPKYSVTDLDNENFRTVGEVIAVSLAQGGPPPAFFKEWCYNFLCNGEVDLRTLSQEDVTDLESCQLINNVENSTDPESLMVLIDDIVNCGYSSQIKLDNKKSIIRAVVLHSTTRLIPMLQQVRKGLELYGLLDQMAAHPEACYSLFVPGKIEKPDADFIMMHCKAEYSEKGTAGERAERRIMAFFQDFLEELEMSDVKEEEVLTVEHVLKWITGQAHIPILPDEKRHFKITVKFNHECIEQLGPHSVCYPTVSACSQTVTFPIQHLDTLNDFTRIMSEAVRYGGGFHRV